MSAVNYRVASAYGNAQKCVPQPWMVSVLLRGALDHLAGAQQAYANGRRAEGMARANKAVAILQGLRDNLKPEVSQQLSGRLDQFYYTSILHIARLMKTGFDEEACTRVMANIKLVYDAWIALENEGHGKD